MAAAILIVIISVSLFGTGYALWRHNTEVRFKLTISPPEDDGNDCICGTYDTIQEGIDLLKNVQYPKFCSRMGRFGDRLEARIVELNNLPFGGITYAELSNECNHYRNVDIAGFGTTINIFGTCINKLAEFYRNSSREEKAAVPDFWTQHNALWDLSDQLWDKRSELYPLVNAVWEAGESKIDYNHGGGKGH